MPSTAKVTRQRRQRRRRTIRKRLAGTAQRPRLSVFRSSAHVYIQLIDDEAGTTLVAASSRELEAAAAGTKVEQAKAVGQRAAEKARAAGITKVVFDRGGYLYHGRVRALAEGARAAGLEF